MAKNQEKPVDCIMLSLADGDALILPRNTLIEVIDSRSLNIVVDYFGGIIGKIQWHGRNVPLIAYDAALKQSVPKYNADTRTVVVYSLSDDEKIPYLAFTSQGDPFELSLSEDVLQDDKESDLEYALSSLKVKDKTVWVPDLKTLAAFASARI